MQLVRTEMRVPSCHRQTLVPQQISDILKWSALHSQPACERMPQVVPAKILQPRFNHCIVEPMTSVFEVYALLSLLKHTPSPAAPPVHEFQSGYGIVIERDVSGLFPFLPRVF